MSPPLRSLAASTRRGNANGRRLIRSQLERVAAQFANKPQARPWHPNTRSLAQQASAAVSVSSGSASACASAPECHSQSQLEASGCVREDNLVWFGGSRARLRKRRRTLSTCRPLRPPLDASRVTGRNKCASASNRRLARLQRTPTTRRTRAARRSSSSRARAASSEIKKPDRNSARLSHDSRAATRSAKRGAGPADGAQQCARAFGGPIMIVRLAGPSPCSHPLLALGSDRR